MHRRVEIRRRPQAEGWRELEMRAHGTFTAAAAPTATVDLDELFA